MPEVMPLVTTEAPAPSDSCNSPESASLFMPSALSQSARSTLLLTELAEMETQLRFSQATDALSDLRKHLFVRSGLASYKRKHARGQTTTMRTRGLLDAQDDHINAIVSKYRHAFAAYSAPGEVATFFAHFLMLMSVL